MSLRFQEKFQGLKIFADSTDLLHESAESAKIEETFH